MKILLTGASGQVGGALAALLASRAELVACDRSTLDLADAQALRETVRRHRPGLVINAAAYTEVDRAEAEPAHAAVVNATAPGVLAATAAEVGAAMIHYSTDYVFDGRARRPYRPDDETNPLSVYGRTKRDGEQRVLAAGASAIVVRTSWVYGIRGRNFMTTMLRLAADREELAIVDDQRGAPTWCRDLAVATVAIIDRALAEKGARWTFGGAEGIYHVTGSGEATWFSFGEHIVRSAGYVESPRLRPISTAEYPLPARRPAYAVLDCSDARRLFAVEMPPWRESVRAALAELQNGASNAPT